MPSTPLTIDTSTLTVSGLMTHHVTFDGQKNRDGAVSLPIVMLHGWGANVDLLRPLAERLAALGYTVHALDLPGFGQTPPPPTAWSVYDYADFVLAYMDALNITTAHLFGHSFGGRLSLILGAKHAERFGKIVLADSAGVKPQPPLPVRLRTAAYKSLRGGLHRVGLSSLADTLAAWYGKRYGSADYQAASGVMRETFVKVVNEDLLPLAAQVKPSTLLLWGEHDADTPVSQGKLLEKTIPDAGLVILEGAGHYSYLDRLPDAVRIIDYFFRQG